MFARILVALDGSTFAEHALPYAIDVALKSGAELFLLLVHVRQSPATTDVSLRAAIDAWEMSQVEREAEYVDGIAAKLRSMHGIAVTSRVVAGEVVPAIVRQVEDARVDLVVVTTHGRAGLERAWLGSVADALIREADVPILVVRPADDEPPTVLRRAAGFRHVVVALDGSDRAERAIAPAMVLAGGGRATLLRAVTAPAAVASPFLPHAVRISQEEMERRSGEASRYVDDLLDRVRSEPLAIRGAVALDYHPAHAILGYARDHHADLIAISTHGRGPVGRLLMGSVTDKVVRAARSPVLVC